MVDPAYGEVSTLLSRHFALAQHQAKFANRQADLGTLITLGAAALCIIGIVRRVEQGKQQLDEKINPSVRPWRSFKPPSRN